ncbi:MAG TPA: ATP-binding protein [Longimicrobiales bacterium]|nr:ATP-binding protein [Longimicrobiales bacterium]
MSINLRPSNWRQWAFGFGAAILLTLGMLALRERLDKAHVALLYLLPVLAGAAQGDRKLGLALAVFTFLSLNFLFLEPHYTLHVSDARDWLVLAIYLITAAVAAHLMHRAQSAAARARELAESEQILRDADRLKDALLAAVSHDLRTPLTTIKALAHDLVEEGNPVARDIETQADQLNRVVGDLLDLSRLKAGAMPTHLEINAAEDVIGAVIEQVKPWLSDREVKIAIDTHAPLLLGRFDFVHTLRILLNLIENSHKYSAPFQPIEIAAFRDDGFLAFSVSDRGPGVSKLDDTRIYEAFYRSSESRGVQGAGLGLSIARQLAELQGGTLSHKSRPGGGTVFYLRLPSAQAPD